MQTVTADGWGVSITTGTDIVGVELRAYQVPVASPLVKHPVSGRYATLEEAERAALEVGVLVPYGWDRV